MLDDQVKYPVRVGHSPPDPSATKWLVLGLIPLILGILTGCSSVKEDHYLQQTDEQTGKVHNILRLRVRGSAQLSSARYIAGYYDERSVDLFFNQLKPNEERTIFADELKEPGTDTTIKPLSPDNERGKFVMLLSTNAKAVADAIGQFAENQIVGDAITNLVAHASADASMEKQLELDGELGSRASVAAELTALFGLVPTGAQPQMAPTKATYLRILNAIAAAQNFKGSFSTFKEADTWFKAQ